MSAITVFGAAAVVIGSFGIGRLLSRNERDSLAEGEAFLSLIRHIRHCISCYNTPLSKIIAEYDDRILQCIGFTPSFETSWNQSLLFCEKNMSSDKETVKLLYAFGERLGVGYRDDQIACCDYYIEQLDGHLSKKREELPTREKILFSTSLLFGFLLVIILI